jgi:hypothetical protein
MAAMLQGSWGSRACCMCPDVCRGVQQCCCHAKEGSGGSKASVDEAAAGGALPAAAAGLCAGEGSREESFKGVWTRCGTVARACGNDS